jgi:uncharacterized membrane protein YfcA
VFDIASLLGVIDDRFLWIAAAAALAGIVRGFSGFGTAMVYMPVASALYEPKIAVVQLFNFDVVATLPLLVGAWRRCLARDCAAAGRFGVGRAGRCPTPTGG